MTTYEGKSKDNYSLFIALIKNEDIPDMESILTSRTDIVTTNSNDSTPVHDSTPKLRKDIIDLLSVKGACVLKRNKEGDMPVYNTKTLDTQCINKIVEILEVSTTKQEVLVRSTQPSVSEKSNKQITSTNDKKKTKKTMFLKRPGTSGVSGQLYETKLLSLVFLRAKADGDIEEFYLATNMRGIGAFDDLCCKYKLKEKQKSVRLFLQAKHKDDPDKGRFTVNDLRSAAGDYYLPKYLDSYLSIIEKFNPNHKDPMFRDDIKDVELNFIIYTPAKEFFEPKLFDKNLQSDKIQKMINTSSNGVIFQLKYNDNDLEFLTRAIQEDRVKKLGHIFLQFIMSENKHHVIMNADLIRKYHVVLAQKVVLVSQEIVAKEYRIGKFRPEFLKTHDRTLIALRDLLFKETVENHCKETNLTKEEIIIYFEQLRKDGSSYALSKLIGSVIIYNEKTKRIELAETIMLKKLFNNDEINKIKEDVRKIQVNTIIIHEAIQMAGESKLESIEFKLPILFGNLDLTIREDKVNDRLDRIVEALQELFVKNKEKKIIEIFDNCVGPKSENLKRKLQSRMFDISGGIGGTVGTLLVYDEITKNLKINTNTSCLPQNVRLFFDKLKNVIPEGENLADYRLDIKFKNFPKASFSDAEDDKLVNQFLSRLWFYTNEAQEFEIEPILKEELDMYYGAYKEDDNFVFQIHPATLYLKFHEEIQNWRKLSSEAPYLTKECNFLDKAKKDVIKSPLVCFDKQKKFGTEFKLISVTVLKPDKDQNRNVNVIIQNNIMCVIKIKQYYKGEKPIFEISIS